MSGGQRLFLGVLCGIAGGLSGHGYAQNIGISIVLGVIVLCADLICDAIKAAR